MKTDTEENNDEPFNLLLHFILAESWDQVVKLLSVNPIEAQWESRYRWSALHWACCMDAPTSVIRALLIAYPAAAKLEDQFGFTPMYYICGVHLAQTVVKQDIESTILYGKSGFESLAWRVQQIVKATMLDSYHHSELPNIFDTTDFHLTVWPKVQLMLKAAYHGSVSDNLPNGKKWRILHACAAFPRCPPKILQLAVRLCPEQLRDRDEEGRLPLHLVIGSCTKWHCGYQSILEGYRAAVKDRDEQTELFPFMLASQGGGASLDAAYLMLQACPELSVYMS